jgi:glycosyltransferase involved in cell wall biosynthesis
MAGRITPYKGYENIIKIFNELQIPLHVVGEGRYAAYLRSIAKSNITFLGKVSDTVLRNQYSGAKAFIYPQIEDFGLMPLEAASCGTPTIALAKAGSLETVIPKVTGELIEKFDFYTLSDLITNWDQSRYDANKMLDHANNFSKQIFKDKIARFVDQCLSQKESK